MRFAFIEREKADYAIALLCGVLQVSCSGYLAILCALTVLAASALYVCGAVPRAAQMIAVLGQSGPGAIGMPWD